MKTANDVSNVLERESLISAVGKRAAPGVENLHRLRARFNLSVQVRRHSASIDVKNGVQQIRPTIEHLLHRRKVLRRTAFNHVAGEREGRTRKADERHAVVERPANDAHRIRHIAKLVRWIRHIERLDVLFRANRLGEHRPLALHKGKPQPHRIRHRKNVRKKNGGIQTKSIHRLQRHLAGALRRLRQRQKTPQTFPRRVIFRQVAAGLAHQPQRRVFGLFAL